MHVAVPHVMVAFINYLHLLSLSNALHVLAVCKTLNLLQGGIVFLGNHVQIIHGYLFRAWTSWLHLILWAKLF
jgi:hypothetical protein